MKRIADVSQPPLIMGVLNVTPDSFSDGGAYLAAEQAIVHGLRMAAEGAAVVDVGGESTRPGAEPVDEDQQLRRVLPVIAALKARLPAGLMLSIDTRSPTVAARALAAGATMINDIGGARDGGMLALAAAADAAICLMHMQGTPATMQLAPSYRDVVAEVLDYLVERAASAEAAGVRRERILIDPGIGFGKTKAHNLALLANLPRFVATGYPVLLGTSRKRFMGAICREPVAIELVGATCATTALGVAAGVRIFRVHDVLANRQALEVAWAIAREKPR